MDEPRKNGVSPGWVIIVILLMAGIDGLLTRVLETFWVSLRDKGSPAYLPLEWWMSAPFTVFVFAVLSALLTSFSGLRRWLKAFFLLCTSKAVFAAVTAAFFHLKTYPDIEEAALQASLLSLPSVLVHIFLSGMVIMFLRDLLGVQAPVPEVALARPGAEEMEQAPALVSETLAEPLTQVGEVEVPVEAYDRLRSFEPAAPASPPSGGEEKDYVRIAVGQILKSFPATELSMSPEEIEELSPSVRIPLEVILPQLSEGRVVVDAMTVISGISPDAFVHSPEEVARNFSEGEMELPLSEVVRGLSVDVFQLPPQDFQPEVEGEFPDFFLAPAEPVAVPVKKPPRVVEERKREKIRPVERISEVAEALPEEAFVLREEERLLFERSRQVVQVSTDSIVSQFPEGAVVFGNSDRLPRMPDTVVVPLELILPQLMRGEVKLKGKLVLAQFPEGRLSISEADVIRSLRNGEVVLPLHEILPQLPSDVLAPPRQEQQPTLEEMPDPFKELPRAHLPGGFKTPAAKEKPQPKPAPVREKKPAAPSYAEALREPNPLALSLNAVVRLLPEGAFSVSKEDLKRHLAAESVKVPRSMVMAQLKEGRVVVPVELLTAQFSPYDFAMSVEQIKARFAGGLVEVPLQAMVSQVLPEVSERPAEQRLQPECEEISTPFEEFPYKTEMEAEAPPLVAQPAAEVAAGFLTPSQAARVEVGSKVEARVEVRTEVRAVPQKEEAVPKTASTILRTLIQKCQGVGISQHAALAVADSSVVVLTPPNLNPEGVAAETVELTTTMHRFCAECRLGELSKLVVSARNGIIVAREMVRGDARRLLVLGSFDRNGAGFTSLVFDKLDPELRDLSSLMEVDLPTRSVGRSQKPEGEKVLLAPDTTQEETCQRILATLSELGIRSYVCASVPTGQRVVIAWGEETSADSFLGSGVFDPESVSRRCSDIGIGQFQSLLLVTQDAKVTLNRSSKAPSGHLLCIFPSNCGEGLVRARAAKAVELLGG